jgi:hypothetical protein
MLASIVVYSAMPEMFGTDQQQTNPVFFKVILAVAIACIVFCFSFRRRFIASPAAVLINDPTNVAALKRWQTGHILHFAFSLSVALYGLVLRYTGFSMRQVLPFYIAGFALMLYGIPRQPK